MTRSQYDLNYCENGLNLMMQKGFEGDEHAVTELAHEGGNLQDAVYGYAFGGHEALVDKILHEHPQLLPHAATGYARARNSKKILQLNDHKELQTAIVYGFSLAGDATQIRAALNSRTGIKFLPLVIEGLATTNQVDLLLEFVSNTHFYSIALKAAAKSNHLQLIETLLQHLSINLQATPLAANDAVALGYVLEGFSEGRHFTEAAKLMELGVNPMICLSALAKEGPLDETDARLLLSSVTHSKTRLALEELMETQFGIKSE